MRKSVLRLGSALVCASLTLVVSAQDKPEQKARQQQGERQGGGRGGMMRGGGDAMLMQRALQDLDLTAEQKEKLKPIQQKAQTRMQEIRSESGGTTGSAENMTPEQRRETFQKMRPKLEELNTEVKKEVMAVLTTEQQEKLNKKIEELKASGGGEGWRQGGRAPGAGKPDADKKSDQ